MDFAFGKSHDPRADFDGALVAHGAKRPGQHTPAVRKQRDGGAFDIDGFHGMIGAYAAGSLNTVTAFCMSCISASESRKASVDSAPWFPLTRSTCKASRQPPVFGEYSSSPRSFQPRNQSKACCA